MRFSLVTGQPYIVSHSGKNIKKVSPAAGLSAKFLLQKMLKCKNLGEPPSPIGGAMKLA